MAIKEEILKRLYEGERSGEQLALDLGVTRAAVWKAVRSLEKDGYVIDAATNRGYRLLSSEKTDVYGIRRYLTSAWEIETRDETGSTNNDAKARAAEGKTDYAVIAESQTSGKGRLSRKFYSPKSRGLYVSAVIRPDLTVADCGKITAYAAIATARAVEKLSGADVKIKWVNDLQINGKKICGILTEGSVGLEGGSLEYAVVGIGINVLSVKFPAELAEIATTVEDETGVRMDRNALAAEILNGLSILEEEINNPSTIAEYRRRSSLIGRTVTVNGKFEATVTGIDDDYSLLLDKDGEAIKFSAGEVSVKTK